MITEHGAGCKVHGAWCREILPVTLNQHTGFSTQYPVPGDF